MTKLTNKKLGIIAGGGDLPAKVIEKCRQLGKPLFVVTFTEQDKPTNFDSLAINEVAEFGLGAVGSVIKEMQKQGVEEIVLAGYIKKPSLFNLKLDITGVKILAKVAVHHDDKLLKAIADEFVSKGFTLLGAHNICDDLLISNEIFSGDKIAQEKADDILLGVKIANEIGRLDIGQAVVVKDKVILGVEAVEGTDELLERCSKLRGKVNKGGLLVKISKPQQNLNLDMPSIGLKTIQKIIDLNYDGLVVSANSTIFLDKEESIKLAKKHNLLIAGVDVNDCEN
jgi:UDP-2,3-diacylglucosamine hydrolase